MNKEEALKVLEQAVEIATQKGAYGLKDAAMVFEALRSLKEDAPKKK